MGQGITYTDLNMIQESFERNRPTYKTIFDTAFYIGQCIREFVLWIGCITLTFILCLSILTKYIGSTIHNVTFYLWDKYMDKINRKRIIKERTHDTNTDEDYLVRYYLFLKGSSGQEIRKWPFNVFLHKFIKSDEAYFHNHPWGYATMILSGGYIEHIPIKTDEKGEQGHTFRDCPVKRNPFSINVHDAEHKHWIELNNEQPCWTLFFPLKKSTKKWGFFPHMTKSKEKEHFNTDENTFVPFDEFLCDKKED